LKSSSQLFPVELVSADVRNDYFQDLYSLKPNNSQDKSVEIALLHLHLRKDSSMQKQVLFVHDAFNSHWQWMDNGPAQKLIDDLLSAGVSVWLMDWRGHGSSRKNKKYTLNTIDEMAQWDLPSVTAFIQEKNKNSLQIVAKGYGAQMALKALPQLGGVEQFFFVDAESVVPTRLFWLPGVRLLKWIMLIGKQWVRGDGDEPEPVSFFRAPLKQGGWISLFNKKTSLNELLEFYQSIAHRIVWICSARKYEVKARRLTKKQSRVNRVAFNQILNEIGKLISSQSV